MELAVFPRIFFDKTNVFSRSFTIFANDFVSEN